MHFQTILRTDSHFQLYRVALTVITSMRFQRQAHRRDANTLSFCSLFFWIRRIIKTQRGHRRQHSRIISGFIERDVVAVDAPPKR